MAEVVLPKEISPNHLPTLPDGTSCQEVVVVPSNGSVFGPNNGSLVILDLPNKGYLDPSSCYLRFTINMTNTGVNTTTYSIKSIPLYSVFTRSELQIGSSIVETQNNYGATAAFWLNSTMDVGTKYGLQTMLGLQGAGNDVQDGYVTPSLATNDSHSLSVAGFHPNLFSMADRFIPLEMMPACRLMYTIGNVSDVFLPTAGGSYAPSSFTITNVEFVYSMVNFSASVYDMVRSFGDRFYIKTQTLSTVGASVPSGISGNTELIFNCRWSSVKSLFAQFVPTDSTTAINGNFDSYDMTKGSIPGVAGGGSYQFSVASVNYPSRELSTTYNKSAILAELRKAVNGGTHSGSNAGSINRVEFGRYDGATSTLTEPGKFVVGASCERLSSSNSLLSGISTQNSPISLRINCSVPTTKAYTVYLTALADILLEIEPGMRNATVKQ